jgi:hypothetical protein
VVLFIAARKLIKQIHKEQILPVRGINWNQQVNFAKNDTLSQSQKQPLEIGCFPKSLTTNQKVPHSA